MNTIVKIKYQEIPHSLEITCNEKVFDTSNINQMKIEDIAYPFILNGVKWMGLYEELKKFTGENQFTIQFEGDDKSFGILKNALQNFPVKLATTNNKVIILYNENPFNTKITVNGAIFDTSRIQNRSIEEWVKPIHIRGMDWNGIYQELSDFIGIDVFSIEFVGSQEFMNVLIEDCPQTVSVMFRNPANNFNQNTNYNSNPNNTQGFSDIPRKAVNQVKQNVSDEEIEKNLQKIPIKNDFIRKNAMSICAVLSLIMTAFPFVQFKAEGIGIDVPIQIKGFQALFDKDNTLMAISLFIFPILIIVMNYITKLKPYRRLIAIVTPCLSILFEIFTVIALKSSFNSVGEAANSAGEAFGIKIEYHTTLLIGFWLILISYILTAVVGYITYYGFALPTKNKKQG